MEDKQDNKAIMSYKQSETAETIADAQSNIKLKVKDFVRGKSTFREMMQGIRQAIRKSPKKWQSSLMSYAKRYLRQYIYFLFGISFAFFMNYYKNHSHQTITSAPFFKTGDADAGVNSVEYIQRLRKATADMLNSGVGNSKFYAEAEVETLYNRQQEQIQQLAAAGYKLVVCSSHADCSNLCLPYQGKVYSLDGTSGRTADGRSYSPLEDACGPTKLTHRWCRHTFSPYRQGMMIPHLTKEEQEKERNITSRQRTLERRCRYYNDRLEGWSGIDEKKEAHYRNAYAASVKDYYKFCDDNERTPIRYRLR